MTIGRREFITLLGGAAAAWPAAAQAQQVALPVIGYLRFGEQRADAIAALRKGLGEQGYFEGRNFVFEPRTTEDYDRLPALAAELVARRWRVCRSPPMTSAYALPCAASGARSGPPPTRRPRPPPTASWPWRPLRAAVLPTCATEHSSCLALPARSGAPNWSRSMSRTSNRPPKASGVTVRRGKTDQEGQGAVIAIVRGSTACPVAAVQAWLETAKITAGPVFRPISKGERLQSARLTDRSVANIVKAHAERAGLDPRLFSGHSLRAGFLTSAAAKGASIFKMMDQSRHRSVETLRGYVRDAEIFKDHTGAGLL